MRNPKGDWQGSEGERILSYRQALNEGLRLAMREDASVILIGEDLSGGAGCDPSLRDAWGGPFGVTKGLIQEFGAERVIDTPISEMAFIGAAVGAAMTGLRLAELMYISFIGACLDQILNQAARARYMSGGRVSVPVTIRTTIGERRTLVHQGWKMKSPAQLESALKLRPSGGTAESRLAFIRRRLSPKLAGFQQGK